MDLWIFYGLTGQYSRFFCRVEFFLNIFLRHDRMGFQKIGGGGVVWTPNLHPLDTPLWVCIKILWQWRKTGWPGFCDGVTLTRQHLRNKQNHRHYVHYVKKTSQIITNTAFILDSLWVRFWLIYKSCHRFQVWNREISNLSIILWMSVIRL